MAPASCLELKSLDHSLSAVSRSQRNRLALQSLIKGLTMSMESLGKSYKSLMLPFLTSFSSIGPTDLTSGTLTLSVYLVLTDIVHRHDEWWWDGGHCHR